MLIAEIRRKLPSIEDIDADGPDVIAQIRGLLHETKEDLLTADVFGVLKYLPRWPYLAEFLSALSSSHNEHSPEFEAALPNLLRSVHKLTFQFWPNYPTPAGLADGRTEPDVEISSGETLILLEAKLGSAFGDRQLERELAVAAQEARGREFFLVLVTQGMTPPRFRFESGRLLAAQYLEAVTKTNLYTDEARKLLLENKNRVLWISWETIQKALNAALDCHRATSASDDESVLRAMDMLFDLNTLLALRQIRPFRGFAGLRSVPSPHRPVLLQTSLLPPRETYRLMDAVRVAPLPFGWKCPLARSRIPSISDGSVLFGACCQARNLAADGPNFRFAKSNKISQ